MSDLVTCDCGALIVRRLGDVALPCLVCEAYEAIENAVHIGEDELAHHLSLAGRVHGPALLELAWATGVIDVSTVARHTASVWSRAEFPDHSLPWASWRELFDVAGYTVDGVAAHRPMHKVVLFRAAPVEGARGHSWTSDLVVAKRFLSVGGRHLFDPQIWTTEANPEHLLAEIRGVRPGEPEFVVETDGLTIRPYREEETTSRCSGSKVVARD